MSTQVPPPPPMQQPPVQSHSLAAPKPGPGRKWYVIDLVIFLVIFVPSLLGFLSGLNGITEGLTRVRAPGESEVTLEEGTWTVFYEWQGEFEGESFTGPSVFPGMEAVLVAEDGTEVAVTSSNASFEYNFSGRSGFSVGEVDVPEDGTYLLVTQNVDPADSRSFILALGKNLGTSTVLLVLGIVGMVGAAFVAFIIWLVVIILRSRAKKRMQMPGYAA